MSILVTIIILILLGAFWRQILAGSMLLIAVGVIGILVILGLIWWASHDGRDFEWRWQRMEDGRPAGRGGPDYRL